jgi:arsenite oxidase small subunit
MSGEKDRENSRSYSRDELEKFDGKEGRPFYIVFKGKIYDLSNSKLWMQGTHMGIHTRDEDLAETIKNAPHGEEMLQRFTVQGIFAEPPPQEQVPIVTTVEKETTEAPVAQSAQTPQLDRRNFLKLAAIGGGAVTLAALASSLKAATFIPTVTTALAWPKITVTNFSSLKNLTPVTFNYPLTNTPNILVKLGVPAQGGVGPDKDVVAFSGICQHLGCFYSFVPPNGSPPCNKSYNAPSPEGYCCCHGSIYDFANGAKVVGGPAPRPVPQVKLEYDASTGNINAVAMGPPTIFGHGPAGTTDSALVMQQDLQGGTVVTSS